MVQTRNFVYANNNDLDALMESKRLTIRNISSEN